MKTYIVGGAVRDSIMGIVPKDYDYVVTGSSVQDMLDSGFTQVGKDFPVFINPETGDEWALARTERKSGEGYNGFVCDTENVTIEQDLYRRDLTMNTIAHNVVTGCIDPYGGGTDIENKIIRHVSDHFKEDPVRILRAARFAARYDFQVHESTMTMMREMVSKGEINHLVPERVWAEIDKALHEPHFHRFTEVLEATGAMKILFPYGYHVTSGKSSYLLNLLNLFGNTYTNGWRDGWKIPKFQKNAISTFYKFKQFFGAAAFTRLVMDANKDLFVNSLGLRHSHNTIATDLLKIHCEETHLNYDVEYEAVLLHLQKMKERYSAKNL